MVSVMVDVWIEGTLIKLSWALTIGGGGVRLVLVIGSGCFVVW